MEREFWETLRKEGREVDLMCSRDLPDDVPDFILDLMNSFEKGAARFCFQGSCGRVLDAGCGPGDLMVHSIDLYGSADLEYVGMDFSRNMMARAARRVGAAKGAVFLQGSVTDLPFADASFDHVICSGVITCLPSMKEARSALREFSRVLRPRGTLAVDFFNRSSHFTRIRRLMGERIEPPEYLSPALFREELERAGFRVRSYRGFDFKPFQGYLFASCLRALDPCFVQERFSTLVEDEVVPRFPVTSLLGYRIYVRCVKGCEG